MNAVICLRSLPFTIFGGVFAITTSTPALIKFVHQSFSPLRINAEPSSVGSARRLMFAGSEPAFHSVRAKAEISRRATNLPGTNRGPRIAGEFLHRTRPSRKVPRCFSAESRRYDRSHRHKRDR